MSPTATRGVIPYGHSPVVGDPRRVTRRTSTWHRFGRSTNECEYVIKVDTGRTQSKYPSGWDAPSVNRSRSRRREIIWTLVGMCTCASMVCPSSAGPVERSSVREVLATLQGCLRTIPKEGNEYGATRCEGVNLAVLSGTSLESIDSLLGPPTLCFQDNAISPIDKSCRRPSWLFYYLPRGWRGGGPQLVCWTDDGVICRYASWVRTK